MIGRVKRWLGIEGVKVELVLPEEIEAKSGKIPGKLLFYSQNPQTVTLIKVRLMERYRRGRGREKLIDEYLLGQIELVREIEIPANQPVELDFILPFALYKSGIDELQEKNILFKGLGKAAKWVSAVRSTYRVEAEAHVKGTALNPFDRKEITFNK